MYARWHTSVTARHPAKRPLLRYYAEEAFSFLVRQHAPQAMRVLDMQDFHALRQGGYALHRSEPNLKHVGCRSAARACNTDTSLAGREQVAKQSGATLQQILDHRPSASSSATLMRELAAIHR